MVHLDLDGDPRDNLDEFQALAESAGAETVDTVRHRRHSPDPRYFLGRGKVEEIAARIPADGIELVLIDHAISPAQERNLEREFRCRVLDRTGLILDIFAQRARSHEGKLQVELAQLRHIASRLVRGWSHLERQKGGIGLRGPGETQLEMDRRMLGTRIKQLERKLDKVRRQRAQGRQARRRQEFPVVSLVGYTNAGKSTLFNALTGSGIYADDRLFATLDTTLRRLELPDGQPVIMADTVGFISDLPHGLVAAFRSTLEEVGESDLLLHVVDAADPDRADHSREVQGVLAEIGAGEVPVLTVYNKADLCQHPVGVLRDDEDRAEAVWVSSAESRGLDDLLGAVAEELGSGRVRGRVHLPVHQGRLRARFYQLGQVLDEQVQDDGSLDLLVDLPRRELERLQSNEGLETPLEPEYPADSPS